MAAPATPKQRALDWQWRKLQRAIEGWALARPATLPKTEKKDVE